MAAGKTVIASDVGGVRDIVEDEKTGYFINPFKIQNMKKRVLFSLKERLSPEKIRNNVKKKFLKKHTIFNIKLVYYKFK